MRSEYVSSHMRLLDGTIGSGLPAYLYHSVYLEVDSEVDDEPIGTWDLDDLTIYGLDGWQVIGVIPRTIGTALRNLAIGGTFGKTWGAGMGGNLVGAYVLIQLAITPENSERLRPTVESFLVNEAVRRFPE